MAEDSEATRTTQSLALYRKYRPATFAEVLGQDHVTEPLRQALRSGRINHAYLFSGPRGCGKTSSARILARSLNCVNGPTPDPCGVCDSCVALAPSGPGSIDVIEIDAASHGGVDDARDLRERAFYAPVAGRYKIYIIDEAHMVTQQGFNALLKLVEEPPPHLKFIFTTTEPEKVIPTIRSRTHHYPFRLMPPSVMRDLAEQILTSEGVQFDPAVLPLVVRAGGGSARDSLSILDQLLAGSDEGGIRYDRAVALLGYTDASLLDEIVDAFAAGDGASVFRAVNRVIEGGHEPRRFATDMLDRFRDLIVLASVPDAIATGLIDAPPDRVEALSGQSERYGLAGLTRAADIVSVGLDQMRGATSPRLLLELMCAQVLLPGAATDERSVLARLERLEAGAAALPAQPQVAPGTGAGHFERSVVPPAPPSPPAPGRQTGGASPGRPAAHAGGGAPAAGGQTVPSGDLSGAAQALPGQARPDDAQPGHSQPGQAQTGQPRAGEAQPGQVSSAQPQPGHSQPGQAGFGQAQSSQAQTGQAHPGQAQPGQPQASAAAATLGPAGQAPASPAAAAPANASQSSASAPGYAPEAPDPSAPSTSPAPLAPPAYAPSPTPAAPHASAPPPAPPASHAAGSSAAPARGGVTTEALVQAWPHVLDAVKAKGRVAAIVIGNASLVSLDEAVLTLRFPRQGDVKGFVNSRYEDLLKQVINGMFGINVVVRAITGGGDAPAVRRPAPTQPPDMGGSPLPFPSAAPTGPGNGPAASSAADAAEPGAPRPPSPESGGHPSGPSGPGGGAPGGMGGATGPFRSTGAESGDLPPLPPPPSPDDDEDFDPDDEGMSVAMPNELTGMALVQRELGGQVIAEYDD